MIVRWRHHVGGRGIVLGGGRLGLMVLAENMDRREQGQVGRRDRHVQHGRQGYRGQGRRGPPVPSRLVGGSSRL